MHDYHSENRQLGRAPVDDGHFKKVVSSDFDSLSPRFNSPRFNSLKVLEHFNHKFLCLLPNNEMIKYCKSCTDQKWLPEPHGASLLALEGYCLHYYS